MTMLVLDAAEVRRLLDMKGCIEAMEAALRSLARGEVHQPLRSIIRPPGETTALGLMPVHRGGERPLYALKTIALVPDNSTRGLDPHQGTVSLFDGRDGRTLAIMNATPITAIRTAAATAVATRALARDDARELAIVGTGHQARAHLEALPLARRFERIRVAARDPRKAAALAAEFGVEACATVEQAVRGADVVVTVTSSAEPVLRRTWLKPGAHVNAVGACFRAMRELDTATVAESGFFVDRRESCENEAGDYLIPLQEGAIAAGHIRAELGDVLLGRQPGRRSPQELTVFKSLGLAVEDLFAAEYVLRRAEETGAGARVEF